MSIVLASLLFLLALIAVLALVVAGIYNRLVTPPQPFQERVCPNRCAAQTPV